MPGWQELCADLGGHRLCNRHAGHHGARRCGDIDHIAIARHTIGGRQQEPALQLAVSGQVDPQPRSARGLVDHPGFHDPASGALLNLGGRHPRQQNHHLAIDSAIGQNPRGAGTVQLDDGAGLCGVAAHSDLEQGHRSGGGVTGGDGGEAHGDGDRGKNHPPRSPAHRLFQPPQHPDVPNPNWSASREPASHIALHAVDKGLTRSFNSGPRCAKLSFSARVLLVSCRAASQAPVLARTSRGKTSPRRLGPNPR